MPEPIKMDSIFVDLKTRFQSTQTVAASPATNAETIIATLTLSNFNDIPVTTGIQLHGWAALTVGTSGTAVTAKIHETNASGTTVVSSGALTATAANLITVSVDGLDAKPGVGVYVLTLTVTGGAAESTVSAVHLGATII